MRFLSSPCLIKSAITGQRVSPENRFATANRAPKKRVFDEGFGPSRRPLLRTVALASTAATNRAAPREQRPPPRRRTGQNENRFRRGDIVVHQCLLLSPGDPTPKKTQRDRRPSRCATQRQRP